MLKILASISHRTLGDFTSFALLIASLRELVSEAQLCVHYIDNRPYKGVIASYIWNADAFLIDADNPAPRDLLGQGPGLQVMTRAGAMTENWRPDLIITTDMLRHGMLNTIPLTVLRPPSEQLEGSNAHLVKLGLDPDRWVAAVYWKEPGYAFRGYSVPRTIVDPAPYMALVNHIIDDLGGQVVRLGHRTETILPERKGLVDLAQMNGSEWLQLYSVSIARFMVATASGPSGYGSALGVPTAVTDCLGCFGAWRPHDYILTQGFKLNGRRLSPLEAFEMGLLFDKPLPKEAAGLRLVRNSADELIAAAGEMFKVSASCTGWRPPFDVHAAARNRPEKIAFPLPQAFQPLVLIPPSQRIGDKAWRPPPASLAI